MASGCSFNAPTAVNIADDDGTNNSISILFETIAGNVTEDFAHGATIDISDWEGANAPLAVPIITIIATSESSGDAPDTHAWSLGLDGSSAAGSIDLPEQDSSTNQHISEGDGLKIIILDLSRGNGIFNVGYTGSNCGGATAASDVQITLTA